VLHEERRTPLQRLYDFEIDLIEKLERRGLICLLFELIEFVVVDAL
jgi:hypothetical protein